MGNSRNIPSMQKFVQLIVFENGNEVRFFRVSVLFTKRAEGGEIIFGIFLGQKRIRQIKERSTLLD